MSIRSLYPWANAAPVVQTIDSKTAEPDSISLILLSQIADDRHLKWSLFSRLSFGRCSASHWRSWSASTPEPLRAQLTALVLPAGACKAAEVTTEAARRPASRG
jgi:hypothetical protein